jgi:hypothetical protein
MFAMAARKTSGDTPSGTDASRRHDAMDGSRLATSGRKLTTSGREPPQSARERPQIVASAKIPLSLR